MATCLPVSTRIVTATLVAVTIARVDADEYSVDARPIGLLPPGTVIDEQAPAGWSHLIVKSQPRVTAGDVGRVSRRQIQLAGLFFMATLASVERVEEGDSVRYRIARFASGIGTNIAGRDTIVTPNSIGRLGGDVGFLGGLVLDEMYQEQQSVTVKLRSESTIVYDTPIVLRIDDENRSLVLRYCAALDPQNGNLETLAWLIDVDENGRYLKLLGNAQWLPQNMLIDCHLYVDKSEYTFGIPSNNAFASVTIPQGRIQLALNDPPAAALIAKPQWSLAEAPFVDATVRRMLRHAVAALDDDAAR